MSDYANVGRAAALFWIIVALLLIATAVFFIGRCSTRYTVKVQPTQEKEASHDAQ